MIAAKLMTLAYLISQMVFNSPNGAYNVNYHDKVMGYNCVVNLGDEYYDFNCKFSGIDDIIGSEAIHYLVGKAVE